MSEFVTCPYDGRSYSRSERELATISARRVNTLLEAYARSDQARDPDTELELDDAAPDDSGGGVTETLARESHQRVTHTFMGKGGPDEEWYRLPCPQGPHFVPVAFTEAFDAGKASVIALVGPGESGKTHVLAAVAQRTCGERLLARDPVRLEVSTYEVEQHWAQFRELYVDRLFKQKRELLRSAGTAIQYSSLFMVCKGEQDGGESDGYGEPDAAPPAEWIVVTDSWGESATPMNISQEGWYLATADTAVICVDGGEMVKRLGEMTANGAEPSEADLLSVADWAVSGGELALLPGVGPPIDEDNTGLSADVTPLHYCETATDYLVDPDVVAFRKSLSRAPKPNIVVAITKADILEAALHTVQSPLAQRFTEVLVADPAKEVDPEFLWERNKLVAVLLMASGFESFVLKLLRRFPHPIFTALTATNGSPNEAGYFAQVNPRGIDSVIVNHMISRHWFRDGSRLEGRFGPKVTEPGEASVPA